MLRTGGAAVPQQRLNLAPERQGQRALRGVVGPVLQNEVAWAEVAAGVGSGSSQNELP
jgi:hypothetical protein